MKDKDRSFLDSLPWFLGGIAAGLGLYWVFKPKAKATPPGVTQAAPVAPLTPPERFGDLDSVEARFGQVRELYRMGYMTPTATLGELATLTAAAKRMEPQDALQSVSIVVRIENFSNDVNAYIQSSSTAMKGITYRIIN